MFKKSLIVFLVVIGSSKLVFSCPQDVEEALTAQVEELNSCAGEDKAFLIKKLRLQSERIQDEYGDLRQKMQASNNHILWINNRIRFITDSSLNFSKVDIDRFELSKISIKLNILRLEADIARNRTKKAKIERVLDVFFALDLN